MSKMVHSAGLLMYKNSKDGIEVFLCYPGGPYVKKDDYWMIPKGMIEKKETPLEGAIREFKEETGFKVKTERFLDLGDIIQNKKKLVSVWAFYNDSELPKLKSSLCKVQYPPKSGEYIECPEVVDGKFFPCSQARKIIRPRQATFIDRLIFLLDSDEKKTPENWKIE